MIKDYLKEYGYDDSEIDKILNSKNIKKSKKLDKIKETNTFLEKMNIPKEKIIKMTTYFPNLYTFSLETIISKLNYLNKLGYNENEIKKSFINNQSIISYNNKSYVRKIN